MPTELTQGMETKETTTIERRSRTPFAPAEEPEMEACRWMAKERFGKC